jgi:hypothetical protein
MLVAAFFIKKLRLPKLHTSFYCLPACRHTRFFYREGTEEAIENLSGVSKAAIDRHEDVAKLAMISVVAVGLVALAALFLFRWQSLIG